MSSRGTPFQLGASWTSAANSFWLAVVSSVVLRFVAVFFAAVAVFFILISFYHLSVLPPLRRLPTSGDSVYPFFALEKAGNAQSADFQGISGVGHGSAYPPRGDGQTLYRGRHGGRSNSF